MFLSYSDVPVVVTLMYCHLLTNYRPLNKKNLCKVKWSCQCSKQIYTNSRNRNRGRMTRNGNAKTSQFQIHIYKTKRQLYVQFYQWSKQAVHFIRKTEKLSKLIKKKLTFRSQLAHLQHKKVILSDINLYVITYKQSMHTIVIKHSPPWLSFAFTQNVCISRDRLKLFLKLSNLFGCDC